jgi:hypothetical protein
MHSPHRWSGAPPESLNGLPHPGQKGDATHGILLQQSLHQDLWGRLSILWQPAQILGRIKSTRAGPAYLNPDPIEMSADRNVGRFPTGGRAPISSFSSPIAFNFCRIALCSDAARFLDNSFARPFGTL